MTESAESRKLSEALRECGAECISIVASMMQQAGLPDRLVVSLNPRWIGFIEAKRGSGDVTLKQAIVHERFVARGCPVMIARYWDTPQGSIVKLACSRGRKGEWGEGEARVNDGKQILAECFSLTALAKEHGIWI